MAEDDIRAQRRARVEASRRLRCARTAGKGMAETWLRAYFVERGMGVAPESAAAGADACVELFRARFGADSERAAATSGPAAKPESPHGG